MAPTTRIAVSFNLGPSAPIEIVSTALGHLSAVCQLGGLLQEQVSRDEAVREVLRQPERWLHNVELDNENFFFPRYSGLPIVLGLQGYASPSFEHAVTSYMEEQGLDTDGDVNVETLTYRNPVELIVVGGVLLLALLGVVRDWPERRRLNRARADDYEDQVATRKLVRRMVVDRMKSDQYPIRSEQIDDLITKDVADAFRALGGSKFQVRELDQSGDD